MCWRNPRTRLYKPRNLVQKSVWTIGITQKKNRNCIRPVELCDIVRCHFVTTIVHFSHLSSQFSSIYLHFNHNQQTHTFCRYCFLKYCTRFWYLLLCNRVSFVNGNFRTSQSLVFVLSVQQITQKILSLKIGINENTSGLRLQIWYKIKIYYMVFHFHYSLAILMRRPVGLETSLTVVAITTYE